MMENFANYTFKNCLVFLCKWDTSENSGDILTPKFGSFTLLLTFKLMGCLFSMHLKVPLAPLQKGDGPPFPNSMWQNESQVVDHPTEQGIPTMITWNYGGNNVVVEGSWDNWASR